MERVLTNIIFSYQILSLYSSGINLPKLLSVYVGVYTNLCNCHLFVWLCLTFYAVLPSRNMVSNAVKIFFCRSEYALQMLKGD